jgi:two-component system CheB/CheR fusion protein
MAKSKEIIIKELNEVPKSDSEVPKKPSQSDFPVVGIGASAGGLEALELFFTNVPKDCGMAFVVIQHLDPNYVGIMPELLQRITTMKVFQAADNLKVKQNCVYVIPPNKSLSILNGTLQLFEPIESRGLRLPIDIFFRSLAIDKQDKSIGIILSGMGSDGCQGIKAIKEQNGVVLVQTPDTAKFDGMPRSAIESVIVDIVAPADVLPSKLIAFLKYIPVTKIDPEMDDKYKSNLEKIIILIRAQTGHDFSMYKKNTLFRRIERRKGVHQIDNISSYVRFLQENPNEIEILFKELLIGVTSFFRDSAMWEKLKEVTLPELMNELPAGYVLRAWVTGCSSGEEAYSLAIVFKEAQEKLKKHKNLTLQIFATDLDTDSIEIARKGVFPSSIAVDVSPDRIKRFFIADPRGYRLNTSIREMVVFAPQNVIKDPPFTKLDILTCRNMLIYMETELQKKIISLFNYSLNPGGIMVLGAAETLGNFSEGFIELDTKLKIYKRSSKDLSNQLQNFPSAFIRPKVGITESKAATKSGESVKSIAEQIMLQRFAPASLLVNSKGDIIFITGRTGKYLEPAAGKTNMNIFSMAREGLRDALPGAFRKVMNNYDEEILRHIKVGTNGGTQIVDVSLQRIESPESVRGMIMVVFKDVSAIFQKDAERTILIDPTSGEEQNELELELKRSNEDLQSLREEMQTSQEELKSTNEELQSTNEELQSTNEELTTSKEEMQSLNEELQTVNVELQSKISDFIVANNDMKNLLNSTEIATLFLDKELNIRRFTDSATNIFKLRPTDVGRPFTDQVSDLNYPEIAIHCAKVLKTLITIEETRTTIDKRWFNVRIMPYRTLDDYIDGLVITFSDITSTKRAESSMILSETRYHNIFEFAKDGILILDAESGKIIDVNPFLIEMLGFSREQFIEKTIWDIGFFKDIVANKDKFIELQKKKIVRYENLPLETASGHKINVEFISNVYVVADEKIIQCFIRKSTTLLT